MKFNQIFGAIDLPVLILDAEKKILHSTRSANSILNLSLDKIKTKHVSSVIPGLKLSYFNLKSGAKKKIRFEHTVRRNKNNFKANISRFKEEGKNYFLLTINNLPAKTADKKNDTDTGISDREKLSALFDNVEVLLWSVRKDINGKYYYEKVNDAFAAATNRKPSDYNGILMRRLGSEADFKSILHSLDIAKKKGVYEYERKLIHRGKTKYFIIRIIYVKGKDKTEFYIGSGVDVTLVKRSEELLKISEKKYHDLVKYAPVALTRVLPLTRTLEFANNEFARQSGYTAEEFNKFTQTKLESMIHPGDRKRVLDSVNEWGSKGFKGIFHSQYRALNKKKQTLWLDAYFFAELSPNAQVEAINQIYLDITESKRTEELLMLSEKKYHDLAQHAPVAITRVNLKTNNFEYANNEFYKQSGYSREEFNELTADERALLIHEEDRSRVLGLIDKWIKNGYNGVMHTQYRFIRKNKEIIWLDAYFYADRLSGKKIEYVNQIYLNITEIKSTEQLLRLNVRMYEDLARYAPIGITHSSIKTGLYEFVNDEFERQSGYTMDEINSMTNEQVNELIHPDDREEHLKNILDWANGGMKEVLHTYYRAISKKKDIVWIEAFFYPEYDENKKRVSVNQIYIDITGIKQTEEDLRRSLLEKEILLKEVYHRVKNNLQVINSMLQIQAHSIKDPRVTEMFNESQRRIRIMSMIHEKLYKSRDLTKIDFSSYVYNLVDYVKQSYYTQSEQIRTTVETKNINLGLNQSIPCGLIINELVSNSFKYAFESGRPGKINVELNSDGDMYTLIVEDDGKGFPKDIDFSTTESLGMVIVNGFVDQIHGTISLDRTGGTKWIIKFPV